MAQTVRQRGSGLELLERLLAAEERRRPLQGRSFLFLMAATTQMRLLGGPGGDELVYGDLELYEWRGIRICLCSSVPEGVVRLTETLDELSLG